eukprot:TRINITY_DN1509_c0_g1_i3.p1 TRINITY_DN1509_c0_g1~~TRINITY_DN1509_c0_g1_i3.p1  ORF type:complete len:202 (+),score=24.42 TRINITY_DN1509_c0_g1_i3:49-654(+)
MNSSVLLFCAILLIVQTTFAKDPHECDYTQSRIARFIISETILPIIESEYYDLPVDCPLHPIHDMLLPHEKSKSSSRKEKWKCSLCSRVFQTESHLEKHLHRKHAQFLDEDRPVCLADYCDLLRCEFWTEDLFGQKIVPTGVCKTHLVDRRKFLCQAMMHTCFPPESSYLARRLHSKFYHPAQLNLKYSHTLMFTILNKLN